MKIELRVLSGTRTGQREVFEKSLIAVGRHPLCDMRFDPEGDRDVSSRHAEFRVVDAKVTLVDTKSTNGTFVNGTRIAESQELRHGDVVSFGEMGPKVEFRLPSTADAAAAMAEARPPAAGGAGVMAQQKMVPTAGRRPEPRPVKPRRTTGERIAQAVSEQTQRLRRTLTLIMGLLIVVVVVSMYVVWHDRQEKQLLITQWIARNDSLSASYDSSMKLLTTRLAGLDTVYAARLHEQITLLGRQLQDAQSGNSSVDVEQVQQRLERARSRQAAVVNAGSRDWTPVSKANNPAVALIAVKMPDGSAFTGTAFCISAGGMLVTNRHIVRDEQGQSPVRILVIFSDTKQWLPAHIVKVSESDDLALLQMDVAGNYPSVAGVAKSRDAVHVGSGIAIIGYPLGRDLPGMGGDINRITARSSLAVGFVSKAITDTIQVDAFAGEGSSGSPMFDQRGQVVGVIFGGAAEAGGRIVYAVPSEKVTALVGQ
jgi:S1-C subfamily serine protease